ncbi:MAG: hypothetical protein BWY91_01405 [bacterium ADurb.BinA028]|nr:MAG: hypothetical protein BWY91_01405 [bacterium ADurb.BinA028]
MSDSAYCAIAVGTFAILIATVRQCSSVSCGMRSKASRTFCSGEAMTLRLISSMPAAYFSSATPSRSRIEAMVTRSMSSTATASARLARVSRRSADIAA